VAIPPHGVDAIEQRVRIFDVSFVKAEVELQRFV
jgi:hypothetical protein